MEKVFRTQSEQGKVLTFIESKVGKMSKGGAGVIKKLEASKLRE